MAFEDLRIFLPAQEALAALQILDLDADGKIFPSEMRDAVLNIYRERKHLASTLSVGLFLLHANLFSAPLVALICCVKSFLPLILRKHCSSL